MSVKITNVLLLDNVDPSAKKVLEENGIKATLSKEKFTPDALIKELQQYDGVVVRSATKITSEIIENCPKLSIIGRAGTGVDNVDVKFATKKGVIVMNTPGGNTLSAAEHTCTLVCCLARNVPAADASVKAGKWDRKAFMGHELFGKTLGIVGLGRIGREAATRMQSFGMTTIGFDPIVSKEEAAKSNIEWMTLDEMWPLCDYITVHTPLIPQTKGLLNDTSFAKCKKGVRVINCARGGIIDEEALLRALESGQCGGAGLDVYVEEPPTNIALVRHPKVISCPHLGASTTEAQTRCGREIAEQFVNVSKGTDFFGVLNAPALSQAASTDMKPWISVATNLGKVVQAFMKNTAVTTLYTQGANLSKSGKCLEAALCAGLLCSNSSSVNLINAASISSDLGVNVTVKQDEVKPGSKHSYCRLEAKCETMTLSLLGMVFEHTPLLVSINNQPLSPALQFNDNLLIYKGEPSSLPNTIGVLSQSGEVKSLSSTSVQGGSRWFAITTAQAVSKDAISKIYSENVASISF
uniref:D-3-phosphoglycerate dehydrogenase n=1 Tax=Ciona intestinalis TaxID=7719 RepID=UPI000180C728|nr:D-3-phosphoglycerate dehydrogenase [Ciona intestinalis]|eukprot:XP_002130537.1 D-3-phosphoglycerate dehydrogenase [Ciona intestinalis]